MKKLFLALIWGWGFLCLAGCLQFWPVTRRPVQFDIDAALASYSGPKARVSVADFQVKSPKANGEIGFALRQMLIMAMSNSNRFLIVEHNALTKTNPASQENDKLKPSGLIIAANVIDFEPESSGGRSGVGGGGSASSGTLGGLLGSGLNKAYITLEIQVTDALTSDVLAVRQIEGQASDINGAIMASSSASWGLGAKLSVYANTPLDKAIRICIIETARYLIQAIPKSYYKY